VLKEVLDVLGHGVHAPPMPKPDEDLRKLCKRLDEAEAALQEIYELMNPGYSAQGMTTGELKDECVSLIKYLMG
jgi:hypothetical protein